jgi:hypothetical protein
VQRPEPSEGACGEQKRRFSRFEGVARSLRQRERPVELRSGSDPTTIRSSRRKTPRSRAASTNPSRGRSMHMTFDPSASSIASRIRSPVRGKVGAIAAAWNRVTRGVRESSSRGYVPLLLTVGGQPLDSLGFPAGVCASEAGVFGDAAHRSHSSWPPSKGFSRPSAGSLASTRCE